MSELTPKEIVNELDKYVIGQNEAKRAVAIALRNRYRRVNLPKELQDEITPKNILMIGPTGVGKTEIARRLAKIVDAPFLKVEATKFTQVGYVGKDVDSIVKDLMEVSLRNVKKLRTESVREAAEARANDRIISILMTDDKKEASDRPQNNGFAFLFGPPKKVSPDDKVLTVQDEQKKATLEAELKDGLLENELITITVKESGPTGIEIAGIGADMNISEIMSDMMPAKTKDKVMTVADARKVLVEQEADKLIDEDECIDTAIYNVEQFGIVFIDEIDKIARRGKNTGHGPDVSGEGVQRDILPIVEGTTVNTKYGPVKTDYILFIGAGAFNVSDVDDLIPELQGRFPIHVNLNPLTVQDFIDILTKPENSLIRQYKALLSVDGVNINITDDALEAIAKYADSCNKNIQNIGARRLHTIIENLLDDISFNAGHIEPAVDVTIDKEYVKNHLKKEFKEIDFSKFVI